MTQKYSKILDANSDNLALRDKTHTAIPNSNACDYYRNHLPEGPIGASIDGNIADNPPSRSRSSTYKDGTHKPEYGSFFSSTFGDDPKDQEQIKLGMDYFDTCFEK